MADCGRWKMLSKSNFSFAFSAFLIGWAWSRCGQARRRAQRQATESFVRPKLATPQSDRCAVSAKSQRDLAHLPNAALRLTHTA